MADIRLSPRLCAIAKLIPPSYKAVVDVGTDHGYIPVWLARNAYSGSIYATDIKQGPLEHAKKTAAEFGLSSKINFTLCNGLEKLSGDDIGTVVIAGMGGETIAKILAEAPWTKKANCLLILQPMSKSPFLRGWLFENSYRVLSEQLVDDGTIYEIMTVCAGTDVSYSPAELLIGHRQLISSDPLFSGRLNYLIEKAQRAELGLASSSKPDDSERLREIASLSSSLLELKASDYKNI